MSSIMDLVARCDPETRRIFAAALIDSDNAEDQPPEHRLDQGQPEVYEAGFETPAEAMIASSGSNSSSVAHTHRTQSIGSFFFDDLGDELRSASNSGHQQLTNSEGDSQHCDKHKQHNQQDRESKNCVQRNNNDNNNNNNDNNHHHLSYRFQDFPYGHVDRKYYNSYYEPSAAEDGSTTSTPSSLTPLSAPHAFPKSGGSSAAPSVDSCVSTLSFQTTTEPCDTNVKNASSPLLPGPGSASPSAAAMSHPRHHQHHHPDRGSRSQLLLSPVSRHSCLDPTPTTTASSYSASLESYSLLQLASGASSTLSLSQNGSHLHRLASPPASHADLSEVAVCDDSGRGSPAVSSPFECLFGVMGPDFAKFAPLAQLHILVFSLIRAACDRQVLRWQAGEDITDELTSSCGLSSAGGGGAASSSSSSRVAESSNGNPSSTATENGSVFVKGPLGQQSEDDSTTSGVPQLQARVSRQERRRLKDREKKMIRRRQLAELRQLHPLLKANGATLNSSPATFSSEHGGAADATSAATSGRSATDARLAELLSGIPSAQLDARRQSFRNRSIGILLSSIRMEWSRYWKTLMPLAVYLNLFGIRKIKYLLSGVPNLIITGAGGFTRVTTLDHARLFCSPFPPRGFNVNGSVLVPSTMTPFSCLAYFRVPCAVVADQIFGLPAPIDPSIHAASAHHSGTMPRGMPHHAGGVPRGVPIRTAGIPHPPGGVPLHAGSMMGPTVRPPTPEMLFGAEARDHGERLPSASSIPAFGVPIQSTRINGLQVLGVMGLPPTGEPLQPQRRPLDRLYAKRSPSPSAVARSSVDKVVTSPSSFGPSLSSVLATKDESQAGVPSPMPYFPGGATAVSSADQEIARLRQQDRQAQHHAARHHAQHHGAYSRHYQSEQQAEPISIYELALRCRQEMIRKEELNATQSVNGRQQTQGPRLPDTTTIFDIFTERNIKLAHHQHHLRGVSAAAGANGHSSPQYPNRHHHHRHHHHHPSGISSSVDSSSNREQAPPAANLSSTELSASSDFSSQRPLGTIMTAHHLPLHLEGRQHAPIGIQYPLGGELQHPGLYHNNNHHHPHHHLQLAGRHRQSTKLPNIATRNPLSASDAIIQHLPADYIEEPHRFQKSSIVEHPHPPTSSSGQHPPHHHYHVADDATSTGTAMAPPSSSSSSDTSITLSAAAEFVIAAAAAAAAQAAAAGESNSSTTNENLKIQKSLATINSLVVGTRSSLGDGSVRSGGMGTGVTTQASGGGRDGMQKEDKNGLCEDDHRAEGTEDGGGDFHHSPSPIVGGMASREMPPSEELNALLRDILTRHAAAPFSRGQTVQSNKMSLDFQCPQRVGRKHNDEVDDELMMAKLVSAANGRMNPKSFPNCSPKKQLPHRQNLIIAASPPEDGVIRG